MNLQSIVTIILILISQWIHAEISISVDRNPVVVDDSFQLIFESDKKVKGAPDFSPLKKSFTILNTGRRSNTQIINGDVKLSQQWIVTVIPKRTGVTDIPSIKFGKEISKPGTIEVVANAAHLAGSTTDNIFIEIDVDTKVPYVQAQIVYTVKLFRAIQTNNASLSEPEISGGQAIINKLGEDKSFETRIKGKRYVVIQRQYVIFPQSSGSLKIEPLIFQGQSGSGSFFGFDPFGPQPKSFVKRSESIELDVKSIPDSFTGDNWLPSSQLTIQEQWSVDPGKLQQGEATTRTLTLNAKGLASSNLPKIKSNLPDKLKQYPDQPEFSETMNENGIIGIRHDKMAIIPTEGGDFVLPAINIPWWNTESDKMEIAELPERRIHANSVTSPSSELKQEPLIVNEPAPIIDETKVDNIKTTEPVDNEIPWKWVSLFLFILWMITSILYWRVKSTIGESDNESSEELSRRQYLKLLKRACAQNNPTMAKQALLDWARIMWPDQSISSIDAIKSFCTGDMQIKIDKLNTCLYGKEPAKWDGADFLKIFESQSFGSNKSIVVTGKLEPLYKT